MRPSIVLFAVVLFAWFAFEGPAFADKAENAILSMEQAPAAASASGSWDAIARSASKFYHWGFLTRLLLGLAIAVSCAWIIAWHPRRSTRVDPLSDLEERKTLILLGMVGAVASELLTVNPAVAFVIFGIGALIRFRTVLDNPKVTGKAILVVVVGLAAGLGEWAMAVFVTVAGWGLIFWLDSHLSARIRLKLNSKLDIRHIYADVQEFLHKNHCRIKGASVYEEKRQIVFLAHIPSDLDPVELETSLRAKLPRAAEGCEVDIRVQ
ncbi:MAG: hypothetical protein KF724_07500 [Phycisphaeraceae bacterium]|nr:hypothetical protein [Phycisphaeraceae bacterium]